MSHGGHGAFSPWAHRMVTCTAVGTEGGITGSGAAVLRRSPANPDGKIPDGKIPRTDPDGLTVLNPAITRPLSRAFPGGCYHGDLPLATGRLRPELGKAKLLR